MLRASLISLSIAVVPAVAGAQSMSMPAKNIVETAVSAGQFNTLAPALKAAGLVTTLEGPGPFTVFAPTDAAFAKLPAGTVHSLLKPKNKKKLIAILTYHVVAGDVTAADVVKLTSAKTLNGQSVTITVNGGTVKINDATVVKTDITASNGVIHVIDSVLIRSKTRYARPGRAAEQGPGLASPRRLCASRHRVALRLFRVVERQRVGVRRSRDRLAGDGQRRTVHGGGADSG